MAVSSRRFFCFEPFIWEEFVDLLGGVPHDAPQHVLEITRQRNGKGEVPVVSFRGFTSHLIRSPKVISAVSRSYSACRFIQLRASVPKKRAGRRAISAVMARVPAHISSMRFRGTPMDSANRQGVISIGTRKSSRRIWPGWTGRKPRLFIGGGVLFVLG